MKQNKYRRGGHILSLDELAKQDFVYFRHKIYHEGWFGSWQLRFIKRNIGENGHIYYAEKVVEDTIICNKCGKKFADESELKRFMEVQITADDIGIIDFDKNLTDEPGVEIIRGCPYCRTDAYLMDLEEGEEVEGDS